MIKSMLADVKCVYPEDGSVGQDGTVLHGAKRDSGDAHLITLWPTITENRPLTKSVKISFSTFYSIAIVRCQNILHNVVNGFLLYTNQSSRILSRFAPFSLSIVPCTVPSYAPCTVPSCPIGGARRDIWVPILFLQFHKMGVKIGQLVPENIQGLMLFQTNKFKNLKYYKLMTMT